MTSETVLETQIESRSLEDRRIFTNTLVVILGVTWGLAFVAIRTADFQLSPVNLTILRWLIASAGFLTLAPFYGKPRQPVQRHHIPRILVVSLASVTGYHLSLNYAETIVSAGLAGLLISLGPIFVIVPQGEDREKTHSSTGSSHDRGSGAVFERWIELSGNNWSACRCFLGFHVLSVRSRLKASSEGVRSSPHRDLGRPDWHRIHAAFDHRQFRHSNPTAFDDNLVVGHLLGASEYSACECDPLPPYREPISI